MEYISKGNGTVVSSSYSAELFSISYFTPRDGNWLKSIFMSPKTLHWYACVRMFLCIFKIYSRRAEGADVVCAKFNIDFVHSSPDPFYRSYCQPSNTMGWKKCIFLAARTRTITPPLHGFQMKVLQVHDELLLLFVLDTHRAYD